MSSACLKVEYVTITAQLGRSKSTLDETEATPARAEMFASLSKEFRATHPNVGGEVEVYVPG